MTMKQFDPVRAKHLRENPSSVFIIYSWDDDTHKAWVRKLAEKLQGLGHAVVLDQFEDMPEYVDLMATGFSCSNVLVVASPAFLVQLAVRPGPYGKTSDGVLFDEMQLLIGQNNDRKHMRIATILRPCVECICDFPILDFRNDNQFEAALSGLLFFLSSSYRAGGLFPSPHFFVTSGEGQAMVGSLVESHDAAAPKNLSSTRFFSQFLR